MLAIDFSFFFFFSSRRRHTRYIGDWSSDVCSSDLIGKARTAVLFKKPTRFFEELINKGRTAMTAVDGFTPLIGGIPIVTDGQVVGGIGVSGAASANQDEELALAGAAAFAVAGRAQAGGHEDNQPGS